MAIQRVTPQEAAKLLEAGYTYVDVRSAVEFEAGRPAGSVNIPFMHRTGVGMSPNPDFLAVLKAAFPKDSRFVLGCQGGNRSMRAAELLAAEGYAELVEQRAGFGGTQTEAGWANAGLPVESGPAPGRDWESMRAKA